MYGSEFKHSFSNSRCSFSWRYSFSFTCECMFGRHFYHFIKWQYRNYSMATFRRWRNNLVSKYKWSDIIKLYNTKFECGNIVQSSCNEWSMYFSEFHNSCG